MSDERQININLTSLDAFAARILTRMDRQDDTLKRQDEVLRQILDQAKITNGRVNHLERWRDTTLAKVAGISATISAMFAIIVFLAKYLAGG